ncbi:hypothetical protein [Variovorax boronicumulans]|uniref:hypothetical protein n=1 Tax=Variovorax boronicumulans TaxID=436515 RepID=UPI001C567D45
MRLDTTRFPLVFMREAEQQPSAVGTPEQALEALLDRGERFVLLTDHLPGDHADESHEDRKQRALFFKRHKAWLRALCQGMVLITGNRAIPAAVRLAAQGAGKVLGLAIAFVETEREAAEAAEKWLAKAEGVGEEG